MIKPVRRMANDTTFKVFPRSRDNWVAPTANDLCIFLRELVRHMRDS